LAASVPSLKRNISILMTFDLRTTPDPADHVAASLRCRAKRRARRGQSLVEFALVSLVIYMILAAILTFGHMLFVAQGAQQSVDVAAREISRTPLPADSHTLEQILHGNANSDPLLADVRGQVYDDHYLVLNLDTLHGRASLQELIADLPVVNQQLVPLMIYEEIGGSPGTRVLRYPGALVADIETGDDPADPPASGFKVQIPLVTRDGDGTETIEVVDVIEEISASSDAGPFRISQGGTVALRINYPYQSASMSGFEPRPAIGEEGDTDMGQVIVANEAADIEHGTYAGEQGLGVQQAFGTRVRPFRRVISAQAIYRREVFSE